MRIYNKKYYRGFIAFIICFCFWLGGCEASQTGDFAHQQAIENSYTLENVPEYSDEPYVILSENEPDFTDKEKERTDAFEIYSRLDEFGRCRVAYANICSELMPTEKRGKIGHIRPSGWHTVKYEGVDGNFLYNRCHLIGFQLAGENGNEKNLITGTRYMNVEGMLPFEDEVANYVRKTNHHVLYRVTPVYDGDDLVARGIQMEAFSVEDAGKGVCFNVFVYNVQPGIGIDYATGDSWRMESLGEKMTEEGIYILNTNTMKFHRSDCSSVEKIAEHNKEYSNESRDLLMEQGFSPCGSCKP